MTNRLPGPGRQPRRATVALGLVIAVTALATGATGDRSNLSVSEVPTPTVRNSIRNAAPAVGVRDEPRPGEASGLPRGPTSAARSEVPARIETSSDPRQGSPVLVPPHAVRPFAINLFDKGDFVAQARSDWCVPASILTMINMIGPERARKPPTQRALNRMARHLSTSRLRGAGSEPEGWARTLNRLGFGPYEVRTTRTRAAAIRAAAHALRLTGRPVGLLVWRGAHAWVFSGFRATADPAYTDDFVVTHVAVVDPRYPRGSSIWGSSLPPNATIRVPELATDYLPWHRPTVRYPEKDGQFVLVIPVEGNR